MENATGFTRRLGFRDQVYLLRIGFNEAGAIDSVEVDVEDNKAHGIAARDFGKQIMVSLESGLRIADLAKIYEGGPRIHPVRGFAGVASASTPHDMIMQVLSKASSAAAPDTPVQRGHLRLVHSA